MSILAAAARASDDQLFIEELFSTFLYTGNGSTQTITNGIDLAGKGGLVWIKNRTSAIGHFLCDTARGTADYLATELTNGNQATSGALSAFNSNGFSLGSALGSRVNGLASDYASWTFRRAPKFFDVVTYTGNGSNRTIAHSLGVVPGMIIVKRTDATADWQVYHRSLANTDYAVLNTTAASATGATRWNSTTATSSVFSLGTDTTVNANAGTYVAYLFAHDATATGIVQCGSFTTDGSGNATVTLGWEPQFVLIKSTTAAGSNWHILDNMRGWSLAADDNGLYANSSVAEQNDNLGSPTATGFLAEMGSNLQTFIYLAIRRGPMRKPTAGTQVYSGVVRTGTAANATISGVGFPPDLFIPKTRAQVVEKYSVDRLRGPFGLLIPDATSAESTGTSATVASFNQDGVSIGSSSVLNWSGESIVNWFFRRAPGFFDVVCYTGTGSNKTETHNLTVAPEFWIVKGRSGATAWAAGSTSLANTQYLVPNTTAAAATGATYWNSTFPTATALSLGTSGDVNTNTATYVAYLFAAQPGVSKIGTYTGNGSSTGPTVSTGFQPRFLLVKRTDSTGNWVVWDSARDGSNPRSPVLFLNSTAAETSSGYDVDFNASDFQLKSTNADVNANGGTYLYMAVA